MSVTLKRMGEILPVFNNKDLETIFDSFDEDGEFLLAAGAHPYGERFKGRKAIRTVLAERFAAVPDIQWVDARSWISGERAVTEWRLTGTGPNDPINQLGCDLWTLGEGKALKKDTYYKQVTA
jgi:ketosteroid isomerase-like protein